MSNTVIIAEKPSVASGIARVVGADAPHRHGPNGYIEGNGYTVTWAFGHLVGLVSPEAAGYGGNALPIMPEEWKTAVIAMKDPKKDSIVKGQVEEIRTLFEGAGRIIVATDAGREGELIFRYIYEYLGCTTPFDRLWISSLTDEAVRSGLRDLRPGSEYDALSAAAHARSEADWLLGYNASRALRVYSGYKGNLSLGRVQTPVLRMICDRYETNRTFVPTPFWQVSAEVRKYSSTFTVLSVTKFATEDEAKAACEAARRSSRMRVTSVEKKTVVNKPPLLYDLTSLQRAANSKLGLTADETLRIAQKLYEGKYMTYPRTGSRYIPKDIYRTLPSLLTKIQGYGRFSDAAKALEGKTLCRRSVNDEKVTDHHALLPTGNIPTDLSGIEKAVWEMVCARLLEAVGEDSTSERTTVLLDCGGTTFKATGSVLTKAGWRCVLGEGETQYADKQKKEGEGKDEDEDEKLQKLPSLVQDEVLPADRIETVRKTDKPLPIYTDASLLGEMETCGKRIDDEELRESMKDIGLGTPATRAQTIERLIQVGYIERESKKLLPTDLGLAIWKLVRDLRIADVRTSGEWERDLAQVEHGKLRKESFDEAIRRFTLEVIDDIKNNCPKLEDVEVKGEPNRPCPICGHMMSNRRYDVSCLEEEGGCGLRIPREVAGKKLPISAFEMLTIGMRTAVLHGFKSKSGKPFDARLSLDKENRKVKFEFDRAPQVKGRICPCCGRPLEDGKWTLSCSCGFEIRKSPGGVMLSAEQIDDLLSGKGVHLRGMKNKEGKSYSATLKINTEQKKVEYKFDPRKRK